MRQYSIFRQAIFVLVILSASTLAKAEEIDPVNYAFANYLGTGFYQTSGGAVTVFKIPFSYTPDQPTDNIISWRLPVTVGFFNFGFDEIGVIELPEEVGTLSFVPGLERQYHPSLHWTLIPYIDFGLSKNFSSKEDIIIYSTGLTAEYQLAWIDEQHLWSNKIWYAAHHLLSTEKHDDFATLQTGLDISLPWHPSLSVADMRWTVYGFVASYIRPIRFADENNRVEKVNSSVELGITLKSVMLGEKYFWGMDQIGIGYRDEDNIRIWRLVWGSPF